MKEMMNKQVILLTGPMLDAPSSSDILPT